MELQPLPITSSYDSSNLNWYLTIRWFFTIFLIPSMLLPIFFGNTNMLQNIFGIALVSLTALTNLLLWWLRRKLKDKFDKQIVFSYILLDVSLFTFFAFLQGGIEAKVFVLYAINISLASFLLGRRYIYPVTLFALICYVPLILLDFYGVIQTYGALTPALHTNPSHVMWTLIHFFAVVVGYSFVQNMVADRIASQTQTINRHLVDLKRAQSLAHVGSWELDRATGKFRWSDEMFTIFGFDPETETLTRDDIINNIHPDDRKKFRRSFARAISRNEPSSIDFRLMRGLDIVYVHSEARPQHETRGMTWHGTMHDITEDRLLEESKSDFVSLASHQLRTPATVVKQYLGMVLQGFSGKLSEKQNEIIQKAYDGNERQLSIVNDLLSVVRVDAGKVRLEKTKGDLIALVSDTVAERIPRIKAAKQKIVFQHRRKSLPCVADYSQLRLCIENLIDNASKYSPEKTTIIVSVMKSGGMACISVRDKGVGIAQNDLSTIFQKFTRVSNALSVSAGGSGLGLYWVKKIVDLHHGHVKVDSTVGRGTKFTIHLPLNQKVDAK